MQELIHEITTSSLHPRPCLVSFDSGEECSFYHWLEVCRLIDEQDLLVDEIVESYPGQLEQVVRESLLEVETTTAN